MQVEVGSSLLAVGDAPDPWFISWKPLCRAEDYIKANRRFLQFGMLLKDGIAGVNFQTTVI